MDLACRLGVGPFVARRILALERVPSAIDEAARRLYEANLARNLYLEAQARSWIEALRSEAVAGRVLKGVSAARACFGDPGARTCADLDLLIRLEDLPAAVRVAAARGFRLAEGALQAAADPDVHALTFQPPDAGTGYTLDLHWSVEGRLLVLLDHEEFFRTGRASGRQDPACAGLSDDLMGVVLCLHFWRHGVTLKTLLDFAGFVHRRGDAIPAVRRLLRGAGAGDGLDLALEMSRRVLGVTSRDEPTALLKGALLPVLEACLRLPWDRRGPYFKWLVMPIQFDGLDGPLRRAIAHAWRGVRLPGESTPRRRAARLAGAAARALLGRHRLLRPQVPS